MNDLEDEILALTGDKQRDESFLTEHSTIHTTSSRKTRKRKSVTCILLFYTFFLTYLAYFIVPPRIILKQKMRIDLNRRLTKTASLRMKTMILNLLPVI